jgi:hypothetical protein
MDRERPDWDRFMSHELIDIFGIEIKVGDRLLKPQVESSSAVLVKCVVTTISEGKMYLDGSKVPVQFPGRCVNISALRIG